MESMEFYENYITLFCLEKKLTFWEYNINSEPCIAYYQSVWINYKYKQHYIVYYII